MAGSIEKGVYFPLWVKTNYSFLEGASFPEELVERAEAWGLPAIAITDRDGVYGLVRAYVEGKRREIPVIPGAEVSIGEPGKERASKIVLLATTRAGYGNLCQLLSAGRQRCEKGESRVSVEEILEHAGDLLALSPDPRLLRPLVEAFGDRLYALCTRHLLAEDRKAERLLRDEAVRMGVSPVAAVEVLYHDHARRPLQDILTCIRHGCTLATAGRTLRENAEHDLKSPAAMAALFSDAPEMLARTLEIRDRCSFELSQIRYRYPGERLPEGLTEHGWLRELTLRGARRRYGGTIPDDVARQLGSELALIEELDYGGYFLTMYEIVEYCRKENIYCQGRGSAANSAVCYCLGITAVDPVRMELLFERFLSRERAEPPDIDLDIEHERREEVIQHVYARYGRRYAAMVANVIRYRFKSAVRDVGKALGFPRTDLEGVTRLLRHYDDRFDAELLRGAGIDLEAPATRHLLQLSVEILHFPRHLSIHPGGFLLGHEPVDTLVPIEPATMERRTVIQWDKDDIEDLALFKVDLLGLGSLTAIHRALDLLRAHHQIDLEIATVPAEDPDTYAMISAGDTVGVFQIESRAQMAMLPRLKPRTFYDLVIEVAIVRPGPIQGDMVHPYLRRRSGEEEVEYPHSILRSVLERTLGVPIFQEQVMKLAVLAGGYSAGEADQLRRDMAAWRQKGRIEQHRDILIGRMIAHGIPPEFAERVFSQILGFGEYGFPESHAASFALLAYVTSWLKCHYPAAFACAMLNSQPMGFYAPSTLVEDAKRHGIEVRPIDVLQSAWDCTLENGGRAQPAIRMGLRYVKGLGDREREAIEAAKPPYADLDDFAHRTGLGQKALTAMAEAGAFSSLAISRREALWQARALARQSNDGLRIAATESRAAFAPLPAQQEIVWDYRASSHSTRGHPMERFRSQLEALRIPPAEKVRAMRDGTRLDYVGMVLCRQRPGTASGVTFFTLEDETGFVNLVVWRDVFEHHALVARTASLLGVTGTLQIAHGVVHLVAESLWRPEWKADAAPRSRDFQ